MVTYYLEFTQSGCLVDGEEYVSLDDAYDVAELCSKERRVPITILEGIGSPIAQIRNY